MERDANSCPIAPFYHHMGATDPLLLLLPDNNPQIHPQSKTSHPSQIPRYPKRKRPKILTPQAMAAPPLHLKSNPRSGLHRLLLLPRHFHQSLHRPQNAFLGYGHNHLRPHFPCLLPQVPLGHLLINVRF